MRRDRQRATKPPGHRDTRRTVLIAGAANILVAVLKVVAGTLVGSSAMLAEAAHSVADTLNQGLLLTSLRLGDRPRDRQHPFGHGQDRYFWSLLSAFGIFIAGAGFSFFEGTLELRHGSADGSPLLAYIVLAVCFIAEGTSLTRTVRQSRAQARRRNTSLMSHVRDSPDTTVKAALFEDSAALVGLVLALAGVLLHQLTGSPVWDGAASIAIGVLLILVAVRLAADSRELLIGRAADETQEQLIRAVIEEAPGVDSLLDLLTMHMGPEQLIIGARVAFSDDISADDAETLADRIDATLADRLPLVPHVFLDPTQGDGGASHAGRPPEVRGS
jgi:cation diffusion facilitator family transporter